MARTRTLAQLRGDIEYQGSIAGLDVGGRHPPADVNRLINQAWQRLRLKISQVAKLPRYLTRSTGSTGTGAVSADEPYTRITHGITNLVWIRQLTLTIDGEAVPLEEVPIDAIGEYGSTPDCPAVWSSEDDSTIIVMPPADKSYSYVLRYLPVGTDLASDSDTVDGIAGFEDWIVFEVLLRMMARDDEPEMAAMFEQRRNDAWADIAFHAPKGRAGPHKRRDKRGVHGRLGRLVFGGRHGGAGTVPELPFTLITPQKFGAAGNGASDDTTAFQQAIDAAATSGDFVFVPRGTYKITSALAGKSNVTIVGVGAASRIEQHGTGGKAVFLTQGSRNTSQANTLASNASPGATTLTLTAGKGANFSADDWAFLRSDDPMWTGNNQNTGEFVRVKSVAGDVVTLAGPVAFTYTTGNAAELQLVSFVENFSLQGVELYNNDPAANLEKLLDFRWCLRPAIRNVHVEGNGNRRSACTFFACVEHIIDGFTVDDLESSDVSSYFGYAVEEAGANLGGTFSHVRAERVRHAYTTNESTSVIPDGVPMGTRISNSVAIDSRAAAWDTHQEGIGISFDQCDVIGGGRVGFQLRARDHRITNCYVRDTVGAAVWVVNGEVTNTHVSACTFKRTNSGIDDNSVDWTDKGCIEDEGVGTHARGNTVQLCGGPGIRQTDSGDNGHYAENEVVSPNQIGSSNTYAIGSDVSGSTRTVMIQNNRCRSDDTNMDIGVKVANAIRSFVTGNMVTDEQTEKIQVNDGHSTGNWGGQMLGVGISGTIVLASDDLDVTQSVYSVISADAESGTTDDLATITGGFVGQVLCLRRDGSDTITVKHSTAGGGLSILLQGGVDATIDSAQKALWVWRFNDSNWIELTRNF